MSDCKRKVLPWLPDYDISEAGEVRRITRPRKGIGRSRELPYKMKHSTRSGYPAVNLCLPDGSTSFQSVHRLVCEAFHGPQPTPKHGVAHNDGNAKNCSMYNLRWATQKENIADSAQHGTKPVGEMVGGSKLKSSDIIEIRSRRENGEIYRTIAESFGVTIAAIHCICARKTWTCL